MVLIRKLVLLTMAMSFLSACQLSYIVKSGYEQSRILAERESLEKVLNKSSISEETKRKLRLAQEAKAFAEKELGLKPTKNYSSYVDLKRPYVSWIVQVAKEYELTPYLWHFPLVGSFPYKGFFSESEAQEEAKKFDAAEYDTYIRGVSAYSTLGWFRDPLLNTMMNYSDSDLVELIIHESVHATLFIKSEAEFNERMANYIGQLGAELFFKAKEGADSPNIKRIKLERADQELFSQFLSTQIQKLDEWYKQHQNEMSQEKKKLRLAEIQKAFEQQLKPHLKTKSFDRLFESELNNAVLTALKTYHMDLSDFEAAYIKLGSDMKALLEFCKTLEKEKDPAQKLKDFLVSTE